MSRRERSSTTSTRPSATRSAPSWTRRSSPHHEQWEADGIVDRDAWTKAGAQGLLGLQLDEEYGGGGTDDFRYNVVSARR